MTDARETLLGEVSRDGLALGNASEEMKGDRQIVMTAVSENGHALEYAAEQMKGRPRDSHGSSVPEWVRPVLRHQGAEGRPRDSHDSSFPKWPCPGICCRRDEE